MKVNERNIGTKVQCLCKKQVIMAPRDVYVFIGFAWQCFGSRGAKNPLLLCSFKKIKVKYLLRDSLSEPGSVSDWQGKLYLHQCYDFASPQAAWLW